MGDKDPKNKNVKKPKAKQKGLATPPATEDAPKKAS